MAKSLFSGIRSRIAVSARSRARSSLSRRKSSKPDTIVVREKHDDASALAAVSYLGSVKKRKGSLTDKQKKELRRAKSHLNLKN